MIMTSTFPLVFYYILLLSNCVASNTGVTQGPQKETDVTEILNNHALNMEDSIMYQAIRLLYCIPRHRRWIMEMGDGNCMGFFLGDCFYRLETGRPVNNIHDLSLDGALWNLKAFLEQGTEGSLDAGLGQLLWRVLRELGLPSWNQPLEPVEVVCFKGANGVSLARFEFVDQGNSGAVLEAVDDSEYFVVLLNGNNLAIDWKVFEENYDLVLTVLEVEEKDRWDGKLRKKLIGLNEGSLADLNKVRAVLLKKKSLAEEELPALPEEFHEKFISPDLAPAAKITFLIQPPLWLPLNTIPLELRLLALIPEVRGYLFERALKQYREGSSKSNFSMASLYDNNAGPAGERIYDLCALQFSGYANKQWFLESDSTIKIDEDRFLAFSPYVFIHANRQSYPDSVRLGGRREDEKLNYKLYASIDQDGQHLKVSIFGATNQYRQSYRIFNKYSWNIPTLRQSMALYRCEELERVYQNARKGEYFGLGPMPSVSLGPMKQACSPKFLALWLILNINDIVNKIPFSQAFYSNVGFDKVKPVLDKFCADPRFPASSDSTAATFQELYEAMLFSGLAYHSERSPIFKVSGICTLGGKDQVFEFHIPTLPEAFDLSKHPFSASVKEYLEGKPFKQFHQDFPFGRPPKMDGQMENVRVWKIQFPSYFTKIYPAGTDGDIKKATILFDEYYKYEPLLSCELGADGNSIKLCSKEIEVEWKVDQPGKFFNGAMVFYRRVKLEAEEWEGRRQKVNEILKLKTKYENLLKKLKWLDNGQGMSTRTFDDATDLKKFIEETGENLVEVNNKVKKLLEEVAGKNKIAGGPEKERLLAMNGLLIEAKEEREKANMLEADMRKAKIQINEKK